MNQKFNLLLVPALLLFNFRGQLCDEWSQECKDYCESKRPPDNPYNGFDAPCDGAPDFINAPWCLGKCDTYCPHYSCKNDGHTIGCPAKPRPTPPPSPSEPSGSSGSGGGLVDIVWIIGIVVIVILICICIGGGVACCMMSNRNRRQPLYNPAMGYNQVSNSQFQQVAPQQMAPGPNVGDQQPTSSAQPVGDAWSYPAELKT